MYTKPWPRYVEIKKIAQPLYNDDDDIYFFFRPSSFCTGICDHLTTCYNLHNILQYNL